MGRIYAAAEQFVAWSGQCAPADVERLLARASQDIDAALLTAIYPTDDAGFPTEAEVQIALAEATCAQVEYWLAIGSDGVTTAEQWDSVSIGPVSLSGRSNVPPTPAVVNGVELAPRALRLLRTAGLLPGEVLPW
ncbi:hypothetical protein ACH4YO_23865 [Streptomyces noursei]|uniref:Uncharacterized protein n=1 Tax=Streptomyces gilvosporeus TaxID=553510 RepID=A0A1V0TSR4_9ACTN|nr:hypothetical protein [Streptomyces gilvosporeus]ARF55999.1 hypothetical protein B1H19_19015 [Streptomyces gilvosporeus]